MGLQFADTLDTDRSLVERFMNYEPGYLVNNLSFNDIIPVVEKIEATWDDHHGYFGVHIASNGCTIQGTKLRVKNDIYHPAYYNQTIRDTKIQATWDAIVVFIKWHFNYTGK